MNTDYLEKYTDYKPPPQWYDGIISIIVLIFFVSTILFMLSGGSYCDITSAVPFC